MFDENESDDSKNCCNDDWAVWSRFETWIWVVLLLIQLSMVAFFAVHGRKDKSFRQAFYIFFIAVTVVDCALVLLRPSQTSEGDETIFGSVYDDPRVEEEDPRTHEKRVNVPTIRNILNKLVIHAVVPALAHAQSLFLTTIAVNRFTAFAFPLRHAAMWRARTVVAVIVSLASMSIILGAALPVYFIIRDAVNCLSGTSYCYTVHWTVEMTFIRRSLIIFVSAICCVVSFLLNTGAIAVLVVLRVTGRLQRKAPELQLFVHSLYIFLLQVVLAFQDVVSVMDYPETIYNELEQLGLNATLFPHSSEWLAGVKGTTKWDDSYYGAYSYFTPGCKVEYIDYYDDESRPICNPWYMLLIGELHLRDDPDLSVHTLELCLFTLSGSLFLLIISGNVRKAYFEFYFKWVYKRKTWAQHSSVNAITRTTVRI